MAWLHFLKIKINITLQLFYKREASITLRYSYIRVLLSMTTSLFKENVHMMNLQYLLLQILYIDLTDYRQNEDQTLFNGTSLKPSFIVMY